MGNLSAARALLLGSVMALASEAGAQEVPQSGTLAADDILVTATKRTERLIDVPLAVTALSGDALAASQVRGIDTLPQLVSSLTFTQSTNDLNNNVRIRGVGTALFNVGLESSVSFVVDGVVLSRQGQGFQDLIDIERIEVLRGPQGLLFGKNATAGVINVVTKRPSDTLTFEGEAVVAELDEYRLRGSVAGPLGDRAGFRLTAFWNDVGGDIENVATGRMANGGKSYGVRGKVEFDATDRLNLLLIGDYRKSEADCCQFQARALANPVARQALLPVVPGVDNRQVNFDGETFNNTEQWGVSLEANLGLGDHSLTSITAFRTWDFENNIDVDGLSSRPIFTLPLVPSAIGQFNVNGGTAGIRQFTQELRLASPTGGLIEYVAGLYYFHLDLDRSFDRRVFLCLPGGANGPVVPGNACAAPQPRSTFHDANTTTDNFAAFGEANLNVTDALSLIAGFRWQYEKVGYSGNRPGTGIVAGDIPLLGASVGAASVSDTDLSVRAGVQYSFSRNAQAYFTFTQGYKGRGYDVEVSANFASQIPVEPETVDAWELGFKGTTPDGKLTASIALFHQDYTNLQVQAITQVNGLNQFIPTNAGTSISQGVEVEVGVRPADGLSFTGGFTYLDATIDTTGTNCTIGAPVTIIAPGAAEPSNSCFRVTGEAAGQNRQNIRGGVLPNAPEYRLNLTGRYQTAVSDRLEAFVQSSLSFQSEVLFALDQDQQTRQPDYVTVDGSIGIQERGGGWQLSLYVRNLFDQNFATSIFRDAFLATAASPNNFSQYIPREAQRLVGGSLRVTF